jgi:hypothetical protein
LGVLKLFEGTGDLECVVATIKTSEGSLQKVVDGTSFSIGRAPDCVLSIPHAGISRLHVLVTVKRSEVYIMDQDSSNGTFINGNKIEAKRLINVKPTDEIKLGLSDVTMQFTVLEKHFRTDYIAESLLPSQEKDNLMSLIKASNHKAQEIVASAQTQADHIMQVANEKARTTENQTLLKQEEIISAAQVEGQQHVADAKRKAAQILLENEEKAKESCQGIHDQAERIRKEAEVYFQNRVKDAEVRGTEIIEQHTKLGQELIEDIKEKTAKKIEDEIRAKLVDVVQETEAKSKYLTELKTSCHEYEQNRRKEIDAELARAKEELQAQFEKEKAEKFEFIEQKIDQLEKEYADKTASFEKDYLSRTAHLEKEFMERKARLESEITEKTIKLDGEYEHKFNKLESDYISRGSSLETEHQARNQALETEYSDLKRELEAQHARDIDEAAASLIKQKQMLDSEVQSQRQQLTQVTSELSNINQKYSEVKGRFDDIQGLLQGLQNTEADLIRSLNEKRDQIKKSEADLHTIKSDIDSQQEKFVTEKNSTESQIEEYQQRLAKLKSAFEADSARLKKESEKEIAALQDEIKKARDQAEQQIKVEKADIHKKTVDYMDSERAKTDDYRARMLQEKKELDQTFDRTRRDFEAKTKEVIELEKQKIEDARQAFINSLNRERQVITDDVTIAIMKMKNHETVTASSISEAVARVFNSHVTSHSVDTTVKAAAQNTSKIKLQYMSYGLGLALAGVIGFKFMIEPQVNRHIAGTQEHAEASVQIERPKYVPQQTLEYKDNYTDAVLYTQKFADIYLDDQLHDKWFKFASAYMYETWRVDETKTIEALSASKTLVQNLKTTGANLDAEFYQKGIEKMRETEQDSEKHMIEIFGTKVKYEAFRRKEREFFEPYVQNQ